MPRLNVIGCGKVGRTLARLWHERGVFEIGAILTRSLASARAATEFIGAGEAVTKLDALAPAACWMIGTGDAAVAEVAGALGERDSVRDGDVVFHCSGALPAAVLAPLRRDGAALASAHPAHSFADPERSVRRFAGSVCAMEGDGPAIEALRPAFEAVGAEVIEIASADKSLYHAGTVIASNYLVVLLGASVHVLEAAGIARAQAARLLLPLAHATMENTLADGPVAALTGPIARGEVDVVARQLRALQSLDPTLTALYCELGRAALRVAREQGEADEVDLERIATLLASAG